MPWGETVAYSAVQIVGCCIGAILAHVMFGLPWLQSSGRRVRKQRHGNVSASETLRHDPGAARSTDPMNSAARRRALFTLAPSDRSYPFLDL
jgi:hypothetical protein